MLIEGKQIKSDFRVLTHRETIDTVGQVDNEESPTQRKGEQQLTRHWDGRELKFTLVVLFSLSPFFSRSLSLSRWSQSEREIYHWQRSSNLRHADRSLCKHCYRSCMAIACSSVILLSFLEESPREGTATTWQCFFFSAWTVDAIGRRRRREECQEVSKHFHAWWPVNIREIAINDSNNACVAHTPLFVDWLISVHSPPASFPSWLRFVIRGIKLENGRD